MPTHAGRDNTPIVVFDPALEISPFTLFKRLRDGVPTRVVDIRAVRGALTLQGAVALVDFDLDQGTEAVVLFDDNGSAALDHARRLQSEGGPLVKALFGGLELYEFSLDPEVVGSDTFLVRRR